MQKIADFLSLLYHNNYLYYCNKIFITTAEFDGFSVAAYGTGILHSEWKITSKNITRCNLYSHGQFSQARSQLLLNWHSEFLQNVNGVTNN